MNKCVYIEAFSLHLLKFLFSVKKQSDSGSLLLFQQMSVIHLLDESKQILICKQIICSVGEMYSFFTCDRQLGSPPHHKVSKL